MCLEHRVKGSKERRHVLETPAQVSADPVHRHREGLHSPPATPLASSPTTSLPEILSIVGVAHPPPALSNPHALCQECPSLAPLKCSRLRVLPDIRDGTGSRHLLCDSFTCLSSSASITLCCNYCFTHVSLPLDYKSHKTGIMYSLYSWKPAN